MFTVFHVADDGWEVRGLTLGEAFARVIALAERSYTFERSGTDMIMQIERKTPHPALPFPDPDLHRYFNSVFRSALKDANAARDEIMAAVIRTADIGFAVVAQFSGQHVNVIAHPALMRLFRTACESAVSGNHILNFKSSNFRRLSGTLLSDLDTL